MPHHALTSPTDGLKLHDLTTTQYTNLQPFIVMQSNICRFREDEVRAATFCLTGSPELGIPGILMSKDLMTGNVIAPVILSI